MADRSARILLVDDERSIQTLLSYLLRKEGYDVVRIAVSDHGDGIDPQALSRIFEPFYTADDAQGSGLGLAIASELAERMAGRLSVQSRPGETTFTLEIPA